MTRHFARLLAALALVFITLPAYAQWQVANHAVPIGKGPGVVGFGSAAPATAGQVLLDKGASSNPAFTALGGDVSSVNSSGSVTFDPEIHCLAALTSAADKIAYYTGAGTCALGDFGSALRTFNTTSSSANLRSLLTDEVGTGAAYFVGGALGTPASATLTNATGLPISGITGLGTGVGTALAINTGSAGAPVLFNGAGGTPSSLTLTNATGLPVAGITASTSTALGVGSVELGHASDTTLARGSAGVLTVEGVTVPTISSSDTLTNKSLTSPIITGTQDVQQAVKWSGDISPTQITSNQNDYAPTGFSTASTLRLDIDADRSITGLAGGADGRVIVIHNISTHTLTLTNQDAASTAANRFLLGGDVALNPDTSVSLRYDATSSRWRAVSSAGSGGGGGSGTVTSVAIAAGTGIQTSGTCTITTSGTCTLSMADQYRQNDLLMCANQAKALAGYQRVLATFCDGYKACDGINSGSSSNYTCDTSGGKVSPTTTDTYTTMADPSLATNGAGYAGFAVRQKIASAVYSALSNGTKIKVTLSGATSGTTVLTDVYVGHAGTAPNFDGNQVRLTFSGVNGVTLTNTSVTSDPVAFSFDKTKDLIISMAFQSGTQSARLNNSAGGNYTEYEKSGAAADYASTSVTGYTTNANQLVNVDKVEVATSATPDNMTVITTTQTADATVSNGRVLLEYDNTATPTLNTDLIAKVTCDSGSHWATGTLAAVGKGQGGRSIAETADTTCGANTGTGFAAWIGTANNKSVPIYKTTLTVH